MYVNKQPKRKLWSLLAFLMVLSLGIWACTGNTGNNQSGDEQTEATTEEASTDEHPEGSEHPSEHPEGSEHPNSEHPASDTTAQDSTKQSEHPEHPKN